MEHQQLHGGGFNGCTYKVPLQPISSAPSGMNMMSGNNGIICNNSEDNNMVREQDRFMPIANVIRIMRRTLPPYGKIADDAKDIIQECVSEFISFITGEANERCQREQRKTITAEDILWAMSKLGFDDYIEPLTLYLNRYRVFEGDRGSIRGTNLLVRRGLGIGTSGLGGFDGYPPVYHHRFVHPQGFYGTPADAFGGFLNDVPMMTGGQSQLAAVNDGGADDVTDFIDLYGQYEE